MKVMLYFKKEFFSCLLLCILSVCIVMQQIVSLPPYYEVGTVASGSGVGYILSVSVDPRTGEQYLSGYYTRVISKVTTLGSVSVFAGTRGSSGRNDGTGAAARFSDIVYQIDFLLQIRRKLLYRRW